MSLPDFSKASTTAENALKTGMNYKVYLVVGGVIGAAIYILWFYHVEPVFSLIDSTVVALSGLGISIAQSGQNVLGQFGKYFAENPLPAAIGVCTAVGTVYGIFSKIQSDRKAAEAQNEANKALMNTQQKLVETSQSHLIASQKITDLQKRLENYENDTTLQEAQKLIQDYGTTIKSKTDEIATLQRVIEDLKMKTVQVVK